MILGNSNCQQCALSLTRTLVVEGTGDPHSGVMLVGEAPGKNEDESGNPFVGQSGRLLRSTLGELFPDKDFFITNTVKCRPPKNRDPLPEEVQACRPWLEIELREVNPKRIIALGKIAYAALSRMPLPEGTVLVQVWHPSYALRKRTQREAWKRQLIEAINPPDAHVTQTPTSGDVDLNDWFLAADTETDNLEDEHGSKIVAWSLADSEGHGIARAHPGTFVSPRNEPRDFGIELEAGGREHTPEQESTADGERSPRGGSNVSGMGGIHRPTRVWSSEVGGQSAESTSMVVGTTPQTTSPTEGGPSASLPQPCMCGAESSGAAGSCNECAGLKQADGTFWRVESPESYLQRAEHIWLANAKYDLRSLGRDPRDLAAWDDTQLLAYVLRKPLVGLKPLSESELREPMTPIQEIIGRGKQRVSFSQAIVDNPKGSYEYAKSDAVQTAKLAKALYLQADESRWDYYQRIEKPLVPVLLEMEERGVRIDLSKLDDVRSEISLELSRLSNELHDCVGDVKLDSPKALGEKLLDIGLDLSQTTKDGKLSVAKPALLHAVQVPEETFLNPDRLDHYIVWLILQYRMHKKLMTTYVDGITSRLDRYGVLHTDYSQTSTATSRLSSRDPNLQNIPARTKVGKKIRGLFVARPGMRLVSGDYAQQELRIFAEYTKEPAFLSAFPFDGPQGDPHQNVADEIGIPRKRAKNVNFAAIYGAAEQKLAETAGVPLNEADTFLNNLRKKVPSLVKWPEMVQNMILRQGYVDTLVGWRNYYPLFYSPIRSEKSEAIRQAANMPIQGTGAGIVKMLMQTLSRIVYNTDSHLLLQIHDELIYEVPDDDGYVREFEALMREKASEVGRMYLKSVPLLMDTHNAYSWQDLK